MTAKRFLAEERRRRPRHRGAVAITFGNARFPARDWSPDGLCLREFRHVVRIAETLPAILHLPDGDFPVRLRVAWSGPAGDAVGFAFVNLSEPVRTALAAAAQRKKAA